MAKSAQVREIEAEAARLAAADGKSSPKERKKFRNQLRVGVGLPKEKRKRGGLAGVYDRNKKVILPALQIGAGLLGGPAAAAAVGAVTKGFDKGGRGLGFNLGEAARGGLEGAAIGGATQLGAGAIRSGVGALRSGAGAVDALRAAGRGAMGTETGRGIVRIGNDVRSAINPVAAAVPGVPGAPAARAPMNWADKLQMGVGAIGAIDGITRANRANREASRQYNVATDMNRAAMAHLPAISARVGDRSGAPDLSYLDDVDNVYADRFKKPRISATARIAPPT